MVTCFGYLSKFKTATIMLLNKEREEEDKANSGRALRYDNERSDLFES